MATASTSAVLHDNSRRSLSLQVAQFHIPTGSASAHRARNTIALLCREMPDFISLDQWPPNSTDMYPLDYKIWAVMQQQVYDYEKRRVNDVDDLCQRLLSVWHSIGQNVIDKVIDQWYARLTACVRAKCGHDEHLM